MITQITLNSSLFRSSEREFLYLSCNDTSLDAIIKSNRSEIKSVVESYHYDNMPDNDTQLSFIDTTDYIQALVHDKVVQYNCPYLNERDIAKIVSGCKSPTLSLLTGESSEKDCLGAFAYLPESSETYYISKITSHHISEIYKSLKELCTYVSENYDEISGDGLYCSCYETIGSYPTGQSLADCNFDNSVNSIAQEIRDRVEMLRSHGVSEHFIYTLFKQQEKLSRLIITREYRIFLPDYNNLEITMEPLPKAVYILFLNHPEGIRFKDLPSHRRELAQIYQNITKRSDYNSINRSLDAVLDPTKNSINEKCSRIKEAFLTHFDESLAHHYYITGSSGSPKAITLDRQLLTNPYII